MDTYTAAALFTMENAELSSADPCLIINVAKFLDHVFSLPDHDANPSLDHFWSSEDKWRFQCRKKGHPPDTLSIAEILRCNCKRNGLLSKVQFALYG